MSAREPVPEFPAAPRQLLPGSFFAERQGIGFGR